MMQWPEAADSVSRYVTWPVHEKVTIREAIA